MRSAPLAPKWNHWGGRRDEAESFGGSRDSTCASSTVRPTPTVAYLAVE